MSSRCQLVIRADASGNIGTGHVMRTLSLAQAWQDLGGQVVMVMAESSAAIDKRLEREDIHKVTVDAERGTAEDARQTLKAATSLNAAAIVLDGYKFGPEYQALMGSAGCPLLVVDDYSHQSEYHADYILNQTVGMTPEPYEGKTGGAVLLLGTDYALLRREFRQFDSSGRVYPEEAKNVLVTMGGSDPDNFTLKVVEGLKAMDRRDWAVSVVVGGSNPHLNSLREAVASAGESFTLEYNVGDMSKLMCKADVAITAGGSTCWELARLGVPMIISVLVDNQRLIAQKLSDKGGALSLGEHAGIWPADIAEILGSLLSDRQRRMALGQRAADMIDGLGAQRVADLLMGDSSDCEQGELV